jgi:hypothetical protein
MSSSKGKLRGIYRITPSEVIGGSEGEILLGGPSTRSVRGLETSGRTYERYFRKTVRLLEKALGVGASRASESW